MPAPMPGLVAKGAIIHAIDAALNDTSVNGKRRQIHDRLTAKEKLLDILTDDDLFGLRPIDKQHLEEDWFDRKGGYWPTFQPLEPVVRHGFIQAIEKANEATPPLAIDILWICAGPHFEVTSCKSGSQLTVLLLTPPLPTSDRLPELYQGYKGEEDIFVVRHLARGPGMVEFRLTEDNVEFVQPRALEDPS